MKKVTANLYDPGGVHRGDKDFETTEQAAKQAQRMLEPIGWLITIDDLTTEPEVDPCPESLPLFDRS